MNAVGNTHSGWYYRYNFHRMKKILKKNNIKRKPKRAKREELERLLTETFYK